MTNLDTIAAGLDRVLVEIGRLSRELPCEPRLQAERARRLAALHTRRALVDGAPAGDGLPLRGAQHLPGRGGRGAVPRRVAGPDMD